MTDTWILITPENFGQWQDTSGNPVPIGTRLRVSTLEAQPLRGLPPAEPSCADGPASYIGCGSCPARNHCAWVTKGPQP